ATVSNYSYESVFRAVKTDLFFPHGPVAKWRERSDLLENFVIVNGIYGERWCEEKRWFYKKYRGLEFHTSIQTDEELAAQMELHAVRDLIREPLAELKGQLKLSKTRRDIAEALFLFIEKMDVYAKIQ